MIRQWTNLFKQNQRGSFWRQIWTWFTVIFNLLWWLLENGFAFPFGFHFLLLFHVPVFLSFPILAGFGFRHTCILLQKGTQGTSGGGRTVYRFIKEACKGRLRGRTLVVDHKVWLSSFFKLWHDLLARTLGGTVDFKYLKFYKFQKLPTIPETVSISSCTLSKWNKYCPWTIISPQVFLCLISCHFFRCGMTLWRLSPCRITVTLQWGDLAVPITPKTTLLGFLYSLTGSQSIKST